MTDINQAEHAAQFAQAAKNLSVLAEQLLRDAPPGFDVWDVIGMFASVTAKGLIATAGVPGAADYLRRLADLIERTGAAPPTMN